MKPKDNSALIEVQETVDSNRNQRKRNYGRNTTTKSMKP